MAYSRAVTALTVACLVSFSLAFLTGAQSTDPQDKFASTSQAATESPAGTSSDADDDISGSGDGVETAVIHPFRSANISSEVTGIIEEMLFEEGDPVSEGDVVVKIRKDRYETIVKKTGEKLRGAELALALAEDELKLKEEVLSFDATSKQDVLRIRQEVEVKRQQLKEVTEDRRLAGMDLEACAVKSPFSGHVAVRYKQPFESVERAEKLFAVVDTSKVHAVANVPEALLPVFRKGAQVDFTHASGKKHKGTVDRLGKLIDPKSRTTKVYVLIENPDGELEVGTTGSVQVAR
jgi:RND family efflux transporter MFP subunit